MASRMVLNPWPKQATAVLGPGLPVGGHVLLGGLRFTISSTLLPVSQLTLTIRLPAGQESGSFSTIHRGAGYETFCGRILGSNSGNRRTER
jgi:hypothetical protein